MVQRLVCFALLVSAAYCTRDEFKTNTATDDTTSGSKDGIHSHVRNDNWEFDHSFDSTESSSENSRDESSNGMISTSDSGSVIINGDQKTSITNNTVQIIDNGKTYTFKPRPKDVVTSEIVDINGEPVNVFYENGGIRLERQDGTVITTDDKGSGIYIGTKDSDTQNKENDLPKKRVEVEKKINKSLASLGTALNKLGLQIKRDKL